MVLEVGVAVRVNVDAAAPLTTSVEVVLCVSAPLVAVIVRVNVPVGVFAAVETDSVDVPEPVTEVGLNVLVAPVGNPLTEKATTPLNPLIPVTAGVNVVPPP